jgi:hypothetical protein
MLVGGTTPEGPKKGLLNNPVTMAMSGAAAGGAAATGEPALGVTGEETGGTLEGSSLLDRGVQAATDLVKTRWSRKLRMYRTG